MPLHLKQKLNFSQFGDRFGLFVEGKSICRKVVLRAGVPKEIVYRREVGSPFNSIGYMRTIIQHWELMNLSRHLSINEDVLKYVALESYDIEIPRVHYAFIVTEILLRLFQNNQSPEEISDQFNWLLNKHHKRG